MSGLNGKAAPVRCASRGIGRGTAQRLARDVARVGVHYSDVESQLASIHLDTARLLQFHASEVVAR